MTTTIPKIFPTNGYTKQLIIDRINKWVPKLPMGCQSKEGYCIYYRFADNTEQRCVTGAFIPDSHIKHVAESCRSYVELCEEYPDIETRRPLPKGVMSLLQGLHDNTRSLLNRQYSTTSLPAQDWRPLDRDAQERIFYETQDIMTKFPDDARKRCLLFVKKFVANID